MIVQLISLKIIKKIKNNIMSHNFYHIILYTTFKLNRANSNFDRLYNSCTIILIINIEFLKSLKNHYKLLINLNKIFK